MRPHAGPMTAQFCRIYCSLTGKNVRPFVLSAFGSCNVNPFPWPIIVTICSLLCDCKNNCPWSINNHYWRYDQYYQYYQTEHTQHMYKHVCMHNIHWLKIPTTNIYACIHSLQPLHKVLHTHYSHAHSSI